MSNSPITHSAVVQSVDDGKITLLIEAQDACGTCAAQKVCGTAEQKIITLQHHRIQHKPGDLVTIKISKSMGIFAIAIAYMMPVFIIITALLIFQQFKIPEINAGFITLAILFIYFSIIRIFRDKLKNQITITIE